MKKLRIALCILIVGFFINSVHVSAATFSQINSSNVFLKQNVSGSSGTCTLSSAAMLVRRAALLNGNGSWSSITESSMKSTAWSGGLRNTFSYAGINVCSKKISSNKTQTFINLLKSHPEGIVIYDFDKPHAILLTDYTNGVFYCADPSSGAPSGRIPVSQATITVESADKYWYVNSPSLSLTTVLPSVGSITFDNSNSCITYASNVNVGAGASSVVVNISNSDGEYRSYNVPISNGVVRSTVPTTDFSNCFSEFTVEIVLTDSSGNVAKNSSSYNYSTKVYFNAKKITIGVGESFQFQAYPNTNITLGSSSWLVYRQNPGITVDNTGKVTALKPGEYQIEYIISYQQWDGNTQVAGFTQYPLFVTVPFETPEITKATAGEDGCIELAYKAVPGAEGYVIYRRTGDTGDFISPGVSSSTSFKDVFSNYPNTTFEYYVVAYTSLSDGTVVYSNQSQSVRVTTVSHDVSITNVSNEELNTIKLQWDAVTYADSYQVKRSNSGKTDLQVKVTGNSYEDTTVTPGHQYVYEIVALKNGKAIGVVDEASKITVLARERRTYTISFSTNGGTNVSSISIKEGNTINANSLPTPTKTGYIFDGWYEDSACSIKVNLNKKITSNITLYAKWKKDGPPAVGTVVTYEGVKYKVIKNGKGCYMQCIGPVSKNITKATIKSYISVGKYKYPVCQIKSDAFKNCKELKKIVIGDNMKTIGKNVFYGCKKLQSITIRSKKLAVVKTNAFKGIHKKAKIKVPKSKLSKYKKLLKKAGVKSTATFKY